MRWIDSDPWRVCQPKNNLKERKKKHCMSKIIDEKKYKTLKFKINNTFKGSSIHD